MRPYRFYRRPYFRRPFMRRRWGCWLPGMGIFFLCLLLIVLTAHPFRFFW